MAFGTMTGSAARMAHVAMTRVLVMSLILAACGGGESGDTSEPSDGGGAGAGDAVSESQSAAPTEERRDRARRGRTGDASRLPGVRLRRPGSRRGQGDGG